VPTTEKKWEKMVSSLKRPTLDSTQYNQLEIKFDFE